MEKVANVETDYLTIVRITGPGGRNKCHCGCGKRVTHYLAANGVNMGDGCEFSIWRRFRSYRPRR